MIARCRSVVRGLALLALAATAVAAEIPIDPEDAEEIFRIGAIEVIDPWAKSSIGGAHETKLFFQFRNPGPGPDRLVGATAVIARGQTRFRAVQANGSKRVIRELGAIEIPVGDIRRELSEIGYYVELTGLDEPVLMGKRFRVTLEFERAGSLEVDFTARFHSPKLIRRIRDAAARGDIEALESMR